MVVHSPAGNGIHLQGAAGPNSCLSRSLEEQRWADRLCMFSGQVNNQQGTYAFGSGAPAGGQPGFNFAPMS